MRLSESAAAVFRAHLALLGVLLVLFVCDTTAAHAARVRVRQDAEGVHVETPQLHLDCDLNTGRWQAEWTDRSAKEGAGLRGVSCAARLSDGSVLEAGEYPRHDCLPADITRIRDAFGQGTQITVHHTGVPGKPELRQRLQVYPDLPFFLVRLEIVSPTPIATNDIAPFVTDAEKTSGAGLFLGSGDKGEKPRTLFVPYDNDDWVRYNSDYASESYEVTAVYENANRHGFVLGSVSHDLWKTGLAMGNAGPGSLGSLRIYGGASSKWTRDSQPHGTVSGETVASPWIFVGYFSDWRAGLESYSQANGRLHPPLAWAGAGGVPFGWNSWAAYKSKITFDEYLNAADFVKSSLQPRGFGDSTGSVYINFDSFWDNLTDAQIAEAVRHVHANGQKAGIYWTPFVCWGGNLNRPVEGTGGRYTYQDILLKDASGTPLPKLDSGLPIDPTHPGALLRIDSQLQRFVALGFDFIKLDFLTHGALEGKHFDPAVTTGTAAYEMGMKRVVADLDPARIGRPFFISLSIAPLFPAGYGHSRRISCDAAGGVGATEYMLNSLTYGWWAEGGLYHFNDPDHTVLWQERGQRTVSEAEARSRLNASVITGSMLLDSDDLTQASARERAAALFTNREINALARTGKPFRPVEGNTGSKAADTFVRDEARGHVFYVALFNHSTTQNRTGTLDLTRLGLNGTASYRVRDLWTQQVTRAQGALPVNLAPTDSTILCLTRE